MPRKTYTVQLTEDEFLMLKGIVGAYYGPAAEVPMVIGNVETGEQEEFQPGSSMHDFVVSVARALADKVQALEAA